MNEDEERAVPVAVLADWYWRAKRARQGLDHIDRATLSILEWQESNGLQELITRMGRLQWWLDRTQVELVKLESEVDATGSEGDHDGDSPQGRPDQFPLWSDEEVGLG